jgi:hypothetical protein
LLLPPLQDCCTFTRSMKRTIASTFTSLSGAVFLLLALAIGPSNAAATHPLKPASLTVVDVDGRQRILHPTGQVSVVMYTNGDLEQQSRDVSRALDPLRGRSDFRFIRIVDLRGEVAPIARRLVEKQIRKELDKEAVRIKPLYSKKGNSADPRLDMPTVADFNGNVLGKLGWENHYDDIHLVVFNKKGLEIKRFDKIADPIEVNTYLKTIL